MKDYIRAMSVVLVIGAASGPVSSNAQQDPVRNVEPIVHSSSTTLLQEFRTAKFFWEQAEVGARLVALQDKSVVPTMLALLKSKDRAERCNAGRVLAGLGDDRGLFAVIAELKDNGLTRERPSNGTTQIFLRQILQDRYYAAHVLGQIRDKRAVPVLIEALEDDSLNYKAASVLGHLGDRRAIPALLALLERAQAQDPFSAKRDMRFETAYSLMWLRHPRGLPAVAQCLGSDRHESQRRYAADALGRFGHKDAVPFLIEALRDNDVEVRVQAIMALGRIGNKAAIPALKASLQDTGQAKGRARIRYKPPMPFFKWMTVSEAASQALKQIGNHNATSSTR